MSDFNLLIKANLAMYGDCLKKASIGTSKNWIALPASVLMVLLFTQAAVLVSPLGLVGGFILGLFFCLCLAQYFSWLSRTREGEVLKWKTLLNFDLGMFQAVISAAFILWIVDWIVSSLLLGLEGTNWIHGLIRLALILIFNPLAEVVYVRGESDLSAFQRAYQFTLQHWAEWFVPYLLVFSPLLLAGSVEEVLLILSSTSALFPTSPVIFAFLTAFSSDQLIVAAVLGVVLAHWLMLFRAELFDALESGNRRMRIYKYKNS